MRINPGAPDRRVLASYLAMYGAATMAVPNATIARPSASAKAVRSSRILFEGRGIRVSDNLGGIIPEMIACSDGGKPSNQATPVVWYTFVLNELDAKKARGAGTRRMVLASGQYPRFRTQKRSAGDSTRK
jgi:hypothetical protein